MKGEGESPPEVGDHPFHAVPWWDRCDVCGLAMPAHLEVDAMVSDSMEVAIAGHPYRCPECVSISDLKPSLIDKPCVHREAA